MHIEEFCSENGCFVHSQNSVVQSFKMGRLRYKSGDGAVSWTGKIVSQTADTIFSISDAFNCSLFVDSNWKDDPCSRFAKEDEICRGLAVT